MPDKVRQGKGRRSSTSISHLTSRLVETRRRNRGTESLACFAGRTDIEISMIGDNRAYLGASDRDLKAPHWRRVQKAPSRAERRLRFMKTMLNPNTRKGSTAAAGRFRPNSSSFVLQLLGRARGLSATRKWHLNAVSALEKMSKYARCRSFRGSQQAAVGSVQVARRFPYRTPNPSATSERCHSALNCRKNQACLLRRRTTRRRPSRQASALSSITALSTLGDQRAVLQCHEPPQKTNLPASVLTA